jgi:transposase
MNQKRDQLRQYDKEELIDTILLLRARLVTLEKRMAELEGKARTGVPDKTPENSSVPSSRGWKAKRVKKTPAKRGPKVGHVGKSREFSTPDEVIECRVAMCQACGHDLTGVDQQPVSRRQVVDIPAIRPQVREARCDAVTCPACGHHQTAAYPAGFESGRLLGPHLETLVVYLHHAHPLSYQRVQHILRDMLDTPVSLGVLVSTVKRSAARLQQTTACIQTQIQQAPVVGSDETGVRVGGWNHWQWVFQTPRWVFMRIHRRRAASVIQAVMGKAQPRVWVSDLGSAQLGHPAKVLQVCLAHQVRDLQYVIDAHRCAWGYRLPSLFYRAIRLGKRRPTLSPDSYGCQVTLVEQRLDALLAEFPNTPDSQRLRERYRKHRRSLFVFLHDPEVPPTNNASEQALRNSVIYRKVTGGFRSSWGAAVYADLISILETARRQERSCFGTLSAILAGHPTFALLRE